MTRDAQGELIVRDPPLTCGRLPGVGDKGGVVLYLVGEDGSAVVPPWLPHHHRVLAVALHPVQVRRIRHVLQN